MTMALIDNELRGFENSDYVSVEKVEKIGKNE